MIAARFHIVQQQGRGDYGTWQTSLRAPKSTQRGAGKTKGKIAHVTEGCQVISHSWDIAL